MVERMLLLCVLFFLEYLSSRLLVAYLGVSIRTRCVFLLLQSRRGPNPVAGSRLVYDDCHVDKPKHH